MAVLLCHCRCRHGRLWFVAFAIWGCLGCLEVRRRSGHSIRPRDATARRWHMRPHTSGGGGGGCGGTITATHGAPSSKISPVDRRVPNHRLLCGLLLRRVLLTTTTTTTTTTRRRLGRPVLAAAAHDFLGKRRVHDRSQGVGWGQPVLVQ